MSTVASNLDLLLHHTFKKSKYLAAVKDFLCFVRRHNLVTLLAYALQLLLECAWHGRWSNCCQMLLA